MKPKILIIIRGGLIEAVWSNQEIEYVTIDHDNKNVGDDFISDVMEPDLITNNFFEEFEGSGDTFDHEIGINLRTKDF